ncbi:MAG: ribosomal protein [Phycisphaerales bacterium]|nr:ribosomal protein [Phycisphaerales bacterium]
MYRLAEELADAVWALVKGWGPFERNAVGGQIVRAADSVGANIAEGAGRGSYKENVRFVRIARGSLNETQHFLRRAYRRKLMTTEQAAARKPLIDNLAPQLNANLKSIGTRRPSGGGEGADGHGRDAKQ